MSMKITVTRMHKIEGKNGTVAICELNLGGEFALNGVALNKKKEGGFYLQFPFRLNKRKEVKEYADICHPLTADVRDKITQLVTTEYQSKWGGEAQEQQ